MQVAIVGLARSGKTTVFNTLTGGVAETGGFGGATVNVGVVKVPDERLTKLTEMFKPKREVPADVTYVDLPAPPLSVDGREAAEIPPDQLARLRTADELLHVVRAFDDPAVAHPLGAVDAWRDVDQLDLEFLLADLAVVERRIDKLSSSGRHGSPAEREANEQELALLLRIAPPLREGIPLRDVELADDEQKRLRGYRFLTERPVLLLLNIGEGDVARADEIVAEFAGRYQHRHTQVEALSARIEMEIGQLAPDEAAVFRADLGLTEASLERVIRLSYRLLGLISFFTVGPDETRAWTIPDGSTAVDAAGAIHTDLARGFIRAEIVSYDDLVATGSMAEARRQGKLRSEGKVHQVVDGSVIEVLFNV
jgi:GTP-binding protein YchF